MSQSNSAPSNWVSTKHEVRESGEVTQESEVFAEGRREDRREKEKGKRRVHSGLSLLTATEEFFWATLGSLPPAALSTQSG